MREEAEDPTSKIPWTTKAIHILKWLVMLAFTTLGVLMAVHEYEGGKKKNTLSQLIPAQTLLLPAKETNQIMRLLTA